MMEAIISLINKGKSFDVRGDSEKALACYEEGLKGLLQAKSGTANSAENLKRWVDRVTQRITYLKAYMAESSPKVLSASTATPSPGSAVNTMTDKSGEPWLIPWVSKYVLTDIKGLEEAKKAIFEAMIVPQQVEHIEALKNIGWRAILLYGPPGTGKTMLVEAAANGQKLFRVSASDIMSQWQGCSEGNVKKLFERAKQEAPCIVFIDEVDSLCSRRCDTENESSRRVKTEFMIQMNQLTVTKQPIILFGATNLPWDLDPAVLRRFERKIYVGLPDVPARKAMFELQLTNRIHNLIEDEFVELAERSEGLTGSDIRSLCLRALNDVVYESIRAYRSKVPYELCSKLPESAIMPIQWKDLYKALCQHERSVTPLLIQRFLDWDASQK